MLVAQVAEKAAKGDAHQLVQLSSAAGIASRNATYARREARAAKLRAQRTDPREQTAAEIAQRVAHQLPSRQPRIVSAWNA